MTTDTPPASLDSLLGRVLVEMAEKTVAARCETYITWRHG